MDGFLSFFKRGFSFSNSQRFDRPAPRLKDTSMSELQLNDCYLQCVRAMRTMYHDCKLVHADLSEFNMLYVELGFISEFKEKLSVCRYYDSVLYIIDVSQSVEHDHPHAVEFLKKDCENIVDYFSKKVYLNVFFSLSFLWSAHRVFQTEDCCDDPA